MPRRSTMSRRSKGEGTIRQKPDGRWEALYYVNGERRYITGRKGETAKEVSTRLRAALHDLDRGIEAPKDNRLPLLKIGRQSAFRATRNPIVRPPFSFAQAGFAQEQLLWS